MIKSNFDVLESKKMISDYAVKANNGILNNKFLLNLINYEKGQISRNKKILYKYSQSNESTFQLAKTIYLELKTENNYIHENNLKVIKEIQNLKEKVKQNFFINQKLILLDKIREGNQLKNEYEIIKNKNFLLENALIEKDSIIEKLNNDLIHLLKYPLFREQKRDEKVNPNEIEEDFYDEQNDNHNTMREDCVICDLDGTIALHQGRSPYEWDKIPTDKMDVRMARILKMYYDNGVNIIFLSGRPEHVYATTMEWLDKSFEELGIDLNYQLILRPETDNRKGAITKKELYEKLIAEHGYNTLCVFEDSISCTEMWRSLGLLTCQVANGEY